ncbi:MAG: MFS transporter [Kiloniellaceae bacterium]
MWTAIRSSWTLFIGMTVLMVSHGMLGTLLTLRAAGLGFGETVIGVVQSAYPVGAFIGCVAAPPLVAKVGHVRTFATLASVASAASLVHIVTFDPWSWGAMRVLFGFCFSGLYVVAESWLNGRASNENRASLLSIYFIIQTGGLALGQAFLSLSSPDGVLLLVVASILISLSLVPVLTSASASPPFVVPERISLGELFRLSPMGLSGALLNGVTQGALYVVLALYGRAIGLDAGAIGALIAASALGGMLLQFPLGHLSDRIDRRLVITGAAGLAVPVCLAMAVFGGSAGSVYLIYAGVALIGGLTLPIYSLCVAHTNDYLRSSQIVAASGTLVLVLNAGIVLGPTLGSYMIERVGPEGLFLMLAVVQGLTVITALFRLWRGRAPAEERGAAVAFAQHATPLAARLNPGAPDETGGGRFTAASRGTSGADPNSQGAAVSRPTTAHSVRTTIARLSTIAAIETGGGPCGVRAWRRVSRAGPMRPCAKRLASGPAIRNVCLGGPALPGRTAS